MRRRTSWALLPIAAVLVAGCGGTDTEELEQTINNQAAAQQALQSRLEEVESRLDTAADPPAELEQVRRRVDELTTRVDNAIEQFNNNLEAQQTARREAIAPLEAAIGEIRSSVGSLSSQVQELSNQVQLLREDLGSLQAQFRDQNS